MNAQEMERRFLGNFIHALAMDEQVKWLEAQPEIEHALNAFANAESWMTTPFIDALDAVCRARAIQAAQAAERERVANTFTIAAVLNEIALPNGIRVNVLPRGVSHHTRLERRVTFEFVKGRTVLARYKIDPKNGHGKTCAGYKKFVRERLAAQDLTQHITMLDAEKEG